MNADAEVWTITYPTDGFISAVIAYLKTFGNSSPALVQQLELVEELHEPDRPLRMQFRTDRIGLFLLNAALVNMSEDRDQPRGLRRRAKVWVGAIWQARGYMANDSIEAEHVDLLDGYPRLNLP